MIDTQAVRGGTEQTPAGGQNERRKALERARGRFLEKLDAAERVAQRVAFEDVVYNPEDKDFGSIFSSDGSWYLRVRSFIDIKANSGSPLPGNERRQQAVVIGKVDDSLWASKKSREVRDAADEMRAKIVKWEQCFKQGEEPAPNGDIKITTFVEDIFLPWMRKHKSASTAKSYTTYYQTYLKAHFRNQTLKSYETPVANRFLETMCVKYSKNTVMRIRALGSSIYSYAKTWGYVPSNPWTDVKQTIAAQPAKETVAYEPMDVERIYAALNKFTGREVYNAQQAAMLLSICFFCGLRPSEAAGLKWSCVDFDRNRLHIKAAFVAGKFKNSTKTKTDKKSGERFVSMDIGPMRSRMNFWKKEAGDVAGDSYVFTNPSGAAINVNMMSARLLAKACEKAGLDWRGLYAARRGFGTLLYLAGATLAQVADAMGNSPDVVFEHYFKDKESTLGAEGTAMAANHLLNGGNRDAKPVLELEATLEVEGV